MSPASVTHLRSLDQIPLQADDGYHVVVETPRASRTKFAYDPSTGTFLAKKLLATGFAFPFPFGFFPSTLAQDGDPLDVLLITDAELPMGCLVKCRVLGAIKVEEEFEAEVYRNDRLLAVPLLFHQDRPPHSLADLPDAQLRELEEFFVAYQAADGKRCHVLGRLDQAGGEEILHRAGLACAASANADQNGPTPKEKTDDKFQAG